MKRNSLKQLNLSFNSGYEKDSHSFDSVLTKFIRKSKTLVHLDITGLGLRFH